MVCCSWQSIQPFPGKYREGEPGNLDEFFSEAKFKIFAFYSPLVQVKGLQESVAEMRCYYLQCKLSLDYGIAGFLPEWILRLASLS